SLKYSEPAQPGTPTAPPPQEVVWVDDAVPKGANAQGNSPWEFVKAPQPVFSGEFSHVRTAEGLSQHFFEGAAEKLRVEDGDVLFCHVWLDAQNPPQEIMLQWNTGNWSHRAYWGKNAIDWGTDKTPSRLLQGELPKTGEWVRLEVPAAALELKPGTEINGWAFTQFGGTVYWDKAGLVRKSSAAMLYDSFALWQKDQASEKGKSLPENIRAVLLKAAGDRSEAEAATLQSYFLEYVYTESQSVVRPLHEQGADLDRQIDAVNTAAATTQIFREAAERTPAYMLTRGEYDRRGEEVQRGVPAALPPMADGLPNNRLGLAGWLTAENHPLTSRVTVNRFWQQFFRNGLVKTAEDFGSQGEPPTHPQLLDWLAAEFMRPQIPGAQHNWDIRHIMRLIVTSATYRQSAQVSPVALQKDPDNRLLSRGPRFRLDAEVIRDQALKISGLLAEQVGGPSVKPPQPDGLWFAVGYSGSNTVRFQKDNGADKVHRRSLYTFIKRTAPPPQLATFDAPSREACVVRRERTNSPMQALLLMNDPQYVECARALAERSYSESGPTPEERAAWMLQQAVLREPTSDEVRGLADDFQSFRKEFAADPESATKLIRIGELPPRSDIDPFELAAWTMVGNVILNLDEIINK
ncbi:MAG: DUF1553 domain-containing protein, partial [Planctomycetaceae bacterium]|nr:DUF1553 domain-containing protein [Planctomycetaceae bacterium]